MENTIEEAVTEKEEDNESTKRPSYSQALKSLLTVTDDSDSEEEWFYLSMFRIFSIMEFILSLLQGNTYNYVFSLVLYIFFIYTMTKIVQNKCNKAMRWKKGSRMKVTNIKQIYAPDITPYSLIPLKQRKIKRKFKHRGRRYIAAKIKGKNQRIGNKEKANYHFFFDGKISSRYKVYVWLRLVWDLRRQPRLKNYLKQFIAAYLLYHPNSKHYTQRSWRQLKSERDGYIELKNWRRWWKRAWAHHQRLIVRTWHIFVPHNTGHNKPRKISLLIGGYGAQLMKIPALCSRNSVSIQKP